MYQRQNSLPENQLNKFPEFNQVKIAEVVSNKDFDEKGVLYVRFTRGGKPSPVFVYENGIRVKPEEGDKILVGYAEGKKFHLYFLAFAMDNYACANFIQVSKDEVRIQLPTDDTDAKEHMTDPAKDATRVKIKITKTAIEIEHPTGQIKLGGTTPVARQGDTVQVNVGGTNYTGTITGGSSKVTVG